MSLQASRIFLLFSHSWRKILPACETRQLVELNSCYQRCMAVFLFLLCSSNSSYSDLMPQFLRAVRALCTLYQYHRQAVQRGEITGAAPIIHSVPVSPAITSPGPQGSDDLLDPFQASPNVRRARSIGSLVDGGSSVRHRSQTTANPVRLTRRGFSGHRRTHSQTLPSEAAQNGSSSHSNSSATNIPENSRTSGGSDHSQSVSSTVPVVDGAPADPFQKLEVVWNSLESWFDLILAEVEKTTDRGSGAGSAEGGRVLLKRRMQSMEGSSVDGENTDQMDDSIKSTPTVTTTPPHPDTSRKAEVGGRGGEEGMDMAFQARDPTLAEGRVQRRRNKAGLKLETPQSNRLAAAIVKSTPMERRVAYLRYGAVSMLYVRLCFSNNLSIF